jgi:Fe2+ transport system protein FeoA
MVTDRQPFGGPLTVESNGERLIIGRELGQVLLCAREADR